MAIFGSLTTVRYQTSQLTWLQPAFAYLEELLTPGSAPHEKLTSLTAGETFKRELVAGNFALKQAYLTKPRAQGVFETHQKYVDVQVIFEGQEFMEVTNREGLIVRDAYNPERDAIFYQDVPPGSLLHLRSGDAAIYFPEDAHNGALQVSGPQLVRKTVIKVPVPPAV